MTTVKQRYYYYLLLIPLSILIGFIWPSLKTTSESKSNKIPWDSKHKLEWADFKGKPDASDRFKALTYYHLGTNWQIKIFETPEGCFISFVDIKTDAYVDRSKSWMKPGSESKGLLTHEQGHVNILNIHAKQFDTKKATLIGKNFPCGDDPDATAQKLVLDIFNPIYTAMEKMHSDYDKQTNHSMNEKEQEKWNKKISDLMKPAPAQ